MRECGRWFPIAEPPKEKGIYLVASSSGIMTLMEYDPILYYPFGQDPHDPEFFEIACWANVPKLSEEFTDKDVINALQNGELEQIITRNSVKK